MSQSPQTDKPTPAGQAVPTWFLTLVAIVIVLGLLWVGRDFLIPVAIAAFLLILTMSLTDRLDSLTIAGHSVPRKLAYTIATVFMFLAVIGLGFLVSHQATAISEAAPRYAERIASLKAQFDSFVGAERVSSIDRAIKEADVNTWLANLAASAGGIVGDVVLILLYLTFMLAERGSFVAKLPKLATTPEEAQKLKDSFKSISFGIRQYLWINTLTSGMSAVLAFIVLKFLGIEFAIMLALLVFLVSYIPNIGSFIALVALVLASLLQFDTMNQALIVVVVYGGGDAIIGNVVQPKLQGKSLNMSPLMVMMALAFWGIMWGGAGALLAVPLTVVIMIVCAQVPGLRPFAILLSSDGVLPGDSEHTETSSDGGGIDPRGKSFVQTEDMTV
jgi:AI-2 transport protein TqsA